MPGGDPLTLPRDPSPPEITALLRAWRGGERAALDQLMPVVSGELQKIARNHMSGERPDHTLEAAALVNEAYLRLIEIERIEWRDRAHFFAMCAQLMRRILVDHARARSYQKRGGGGQRVAFEEPVVSCPLEETQLIDLDDALSALAKLDRRKAEIAQLRFFGGLNVEEAASVLGVSVETVHRDWKFSKAWLARRLGTRESKDAR